MVEALDLGLCEVKVEDRGVLGDARSGLLDFGIATIRCSMCQRSTTCAGVTPCSSAISHESRVAKVHRR